MRLRCGGNFNSCYRKLSAECVTERIIKIKQYLAKLRTKVWWHSLQNTKEIQNNRQEKQSMLPDPIRSRTHLAT